MLFTHVAGHEGKAACELHREVQLLGVGELDALGLASLEHRPQVAILEVLEHRQPGRVRNGHAQQAHLQ